MLEQDPRSRVAVETLITTGQVHIAGEVTTSGYVDKVGTRVFARLDPSQAHFFDSKSGASLGIRLGN